MSSRTEQQAGSLEETAPSMAELTGTVKQNADNARQPWRRGGGRSAQPAQRSASAAREIKGLIDDSLNQPIG